MASPDVKLTVGVEMIEPCWPVICCHLVASIAKAQSYLELGNIEKVKESLDEAEGVMNLTTTMKSDLPVSPIGFK